MNIQFASGVATFIPSNINAALLANPTPQQPQLIQEASVDFKADTKSLYGRNQWAVDVSRGQIKASGKVKVGATDAILMNQLYFGMPMTTGTIRPVVGESHAPAASVVIAPPSSGVFVHDRGVANGTTGLQMLKVATSPQVGQYTVNEGTGTYAFNASETAATVLISYTWSGSTSGVTINISSQLNGYTPECAMELSNTYRGKLFTLTLNRCKLTDLSMATKQSDYWMFDASMEICADDASNVGTIYADQ